ncbi:MAG: hypothetical protein A2086_12125 [Spirochaetes bacterium GWD1_27_9]|nr:MAG: hypothetical protein A2Z98_03075 [Spirochaetes bacterium GWB1_27_13]OHD28977.1 MAG: hypothetical protein A2086_12125 [Spirochaetes bacterium GWD1_27_9]
MKFKLKYTDKIVGVFAFLSLFVFIGLIMVIIVNQKIFIKKHEFNTKFEDANGLKVNQDVFFKGFKIGKVKSIDLNFQNKVDVKFYIYDEFISRIKKGSVINKVANPIFTDAKLIFIQNEVSTILAPEKSYIPSLDSIEGKALLTSGQVKKEADAIANIMKTVESILFTVDDLLKSINSDQNASKNSITRILVSTGDTIESVHKTVNSVNKQLESASVILENFKTLSYEMKDPDGMVRRLVDPDGTYMFNSIQKSLDSLSVTMENLSKFTGFVSGQSKQIEALLIDTRTTLKEAQLVIEGIKNNPIIKAGITDKKDQQKVKDSVREKE